MAEWYHHDRRARQLSFTGLMDVDQYPIANHYQEPTAAWSTPFHGNWQNTIWPMQCSTSQYMQVDQYMQGVDFALITGQDSGFTTHALHQTGAVETPLQPLFHNLASEEFDVTSFDPDAVALPDNHPGLGQESPFLGSDLLERSPVPYLSDSSQWSPHASLQAYYSGSEQLFQDSPGSLTPAGRHNGNLSRRTQRRLTPQEMVVLRNWFYLNLGHPYPDDETLGIFLQQTDLTLEQIRGWFNRTRQRSILPDEMLARYLQKVGAASSRRGSFGSNGTGSRGRSPYDPALMSVESLDCHRGTTPPRSIAGVAINSGGRGSAQEDTRLPAIGDQDKVDIEWWLSSLSSESDSPASAPTIKIDRSHLQLERNSNTMPDAIRELSYPMSPSPGLLPDNSDAASDMSGSIRTMNTFKSAHSTGSFKSSHSHHSGNSASSYSSRGARRGRRRTQNGSRSQSQASSLLEYAENIASDATQSSNANRPRCHICQRPLSCQFAVERHCKTVHAAETRPWVCRMVLESEQQSLCVFCHFDSSTKPCEHKVEACKARTEEQRSFWRRDHFMQHLKIVHKVDPDFVRVCQIDLDQWRSPEADTYGEDLVPDGIADSTGERSSSRFQSKPVVRISTGEKVKQTFFSVSKKLAFGYGSSGRRH